MAQNINLNAFLYFPWARFINRSLAIPHFDVTDIGSIDPYKLRKYGFKGVVFDKDNTLTEPYVDRLFPSIEKAFSDFQSVFADNMVVMSNSAGTCDDRKYESAREIEKALGLRVLKHSGKKPGGIRSVREYFQCNTSELVIFGDRIFTDIVFGNRYGLLTVRTGKFTEDGDLAAVSKVRKYESTLLKKWKNAGIDAPFHAGYHKDLLL